MVGDVTIDVFTQKRPSDRQPPRVKQSVNTNLERVGILK